MNVVDSSAWLEWLRGGPNADAFEPAILDRQALLVPSVCLIEVYRRVHQQLGRAAAETALAPMLTGRVVPLDRDLATTAAHVGIVKRLALADAMIYATAYVHDAILWTKDADFEGLPHVELRRRQ
ncbi:MAG: type II toxin-antitoxin system VapC family toxin [Gemmatimonadetes bacterium]|nr:type II toxin-antitoxin system VapC family toxin [Gemmatimonadota bacterium]